jgi:Tetracyclin repressor-like, C-terminal domain
VRPAPDTGTLRGDLLALRADANTDRSPMAALVSSMLGSYFNQTAPNPAELRAEFRGQRGSVVEEVVNRAVGRGRSTRPGSPRGSSISPSTSSATR